jgi:transposase
VPVREAAGARPLNGLDPELYLRTILARIADHTVSCIAELLPWNLATELANACSKAA